MWESRYRDQDGHTPDGVDPHPVVVEQAEELIARASSAGGGAGDLQAADLGSGAGRHTVALAGLGMRVTAVDFADSAHDVVGRDAEHRGVTERITSVTADVTEWRPDGSVKFDLIVVAYLHSGLEPLRWALQWLAPGGRLVWIAHAPDSPHGPPPSVPRESLTEYRELLGGLDEKQARVLRLEEYQLDEEFLDVLAVLERLPQ